MMKQMKILFTLVAMLVFAFTAKAQYFEVDGIVYASLQIRQQRCNRTIHCWATPTAEPSPSHRQWNMVASPIL